MELVIGAGYRVTTDQYNYILQREGLSKKGEVTWTNVSYHGNIQGLVSKLVDLEIKQSEVDSFESLIRLVRNVESNILSELEKHLE